MALLTHQIVQDWKYASVPAWNVVVLPILLLALQTDIQGALNIVPYTLVLAWLLIWGCWNLHKKREFFTDPPAFAHADTVQLGNMLLWFGWWWLVLILVLSCAVTYFYVWLTKRYTHIDAIKRIRRSHSWNSDHGVPFIAISGTISMLFVWVVLYEF